MRNALAFCAGPAALMGIAPPIEPPTRLAPVATWMALARSAVAAGDHVGALRAFDAALVHEPRLAMAHLGRAVCLAQMDREDETLDAIEATIEMAAGQEQVLYALARMCAAQGHAAFAMPLISEAIRAIPTLQARVENDRLFKDHPAYLAATGKL